MAITPFKYQPMFPLGEDTTEYYLLTKDYVSVSEFARKPILKIAKGRSYRYGERRLPRCIVYASPFAQRTGS